ncbi:MAG: hypothetical protein JSR46_00750 [Verrucomicrobia bacterium]|nr:hypothetical protein [Verrucomicrobiota bacterium]
MSNPSPQGPEQKPGQKEKNTQPPAGSFVTFLKEHTWESISYFIIFCGLIFTWFYPNAGGFVVGLIFGSYFAPQIRARATLFKEFIDQEGIFRSFVLIAAGIALLIVGFGLCVGTAAGAILRSLVPNEPKE